VTAYHFRKLSAVALFSLVGFAVLAFGAVDTWALTTFELGIFLLAAVWVVRTGLGSLELAWSPLYLPWGLAVLWTAAQYVLGLSAGRYRTQAEALKWLALWLLLVMSTHVFADHAIRKRFNTGLVWFGFALCVFGLVQHFTSSHQIYWFVPVPAGKIFGPLVNGNHFTALMELIVPAALLLALRSSEQRLIYAVVSNLILAAVVVCASRAGTILVALETIIVLVATAFAGGRSQARSRGKRLLLPVAGLGLAAVIFFYVAGAEKMADAFREEQPYALRWMVVQDTWRLFSDRPWTGYGAGTFEAVYPSAARMDMGYIWSHAHNDPLQFLMEWGIFGAVLVGWTMWLLLRVRWPRQIWLGRIMPLLAVLVHSWFDFPLQIPAIMAAWLVMLAQVYPAGLEEPARHGRTAASHATGGIPVAAAGSG